MISRKTNKRANKAISNKCEPMGRHWMAFVDCFSRTALLLSAMNKGGIMNAISNTCSRVAIVLVFNTWVAGCAQIDSYGKYHGALSYTPTSQHCIPQLAVTYYVPSYQQKGTYTPNAQSFCQTTTKVKRETSASRRETSSARCPTRQREPSLRQRQETASVEYTPQHIKPSTSTLSDCMGMLPPGVMHFQNIKLGDGFMPHVFSTDDAALLVWPLSAGDDEGNAVKNLIACRNDLQRQEPKAILEMVLLVDKGWACNAERLQAHGIRCVYAAQFPTFASKFFVQAEENECESLPRWVWAIGAVSAFCIAYRIFSHEGANYQPI